MICGWGVTAIESQTKPKLKYKLHSCQFGINDFTITVMFSFSKQRGPNPGLLISIFSEVFRLLK